MKLRTSVVAMLAFAALGAGPPPGVQPAQPRSAWSKLKSGAKRLLPGTPAEQLPGTQAQQPAEAPVRYDNSVRYDDQVRPATAVVPQPPRRSFFKSAPQPRRTMSEYMAWEKP